MNANTLITASLVGLLGALALTSCDGDGEPRCDLEAVGVLCTIIGNNENGYDRDADNMAIPALEAKMSLPQDTLTAPDGTLYVLDWNNHRVRRLDPEGLLHWVAGRGELGGSLDDPSNGDFNHPTNIIFDESGDNILIAAWHNSKVRVIDRATGMVTDTCGDGKRAYWGDDGPAGASSLDLPASLALDPAGNLMIMDQANQVLRFVDKAGEIHRFAGKCVVDAAAPAGPGPCAEGVEPTQCPDGPNGPSGKFTCGDPAMFCSKPCTPGYSGDDIPALEMRMAQPFGQAAAPAGRIVFDKAGNLYFADTSNHLIRMIDKDGMVRRIAGTPPEAGVPQNGYAGDDGPALAAKLNFPVDLAFADDGTLYFTDVRNNCVRSIDTAGNIHTAVGRCGEKGYEGDGGPADAALLNLPFGVEWVDGTLLVADTGNSVIRRVRLR
jgi:DNA-binding beta-propeller fold protein YncE